MSDFAALPYRPCAGVMLANRAGRVFVGQRLDSSADAWQMPQGGIDPGESAEEAAIRELGEETGVHGGLVDIIARSRTEHYYDLPDDLMGRMWGGKYRGQRQYWFLMRFLGDDGDVDIRTRHQEFRAWRWAELDDLERLIVPFKRSLYHAVVEEFRPFV
ncbi:MAG: RNA pyrophosphohydrolase [Alphaproteobacteria bacterium HGW-Alphaproteobacteria-13]|nr:MAG: RNA pyrophosphohydrolase [Alphaproteobacteria bacterium HGW-Alphaproteobacteria-13]